MTAVRENGATSGPGVLATYAYDNLGRRTGITRGNGVTTTLSWDPASRLTGLNHNLTGTAQDVSPTFGRNPAGQITTRTTSNDVYVFDDLSAGVTDYAIDGLNRIATVDAAALSYDANGNLTDDSVASYVYDDFNRLISADGTTLQYDPAGRLYREIDTAHTRFGWAGGQLIAEHLNVSPSFRRHVPGPGLGAPVASYEGAGTTTRYERARDITDVNRRLASAEPVLTDEKVLRAAVLLREKLHDGPVELRQDYARMLIGEVIVTDAEIRISGPKSALTRFAGEPEGFTPP